MLYQYFLYSNSELILCGQKAKTLFDSILRCLSLIFDLQEFYSNRGTILSIGPYILHTAKGNYKNFLKSL